MWGSTPATAPPPKRRSTDLRELVSVSARRVPDAVTLLTGYVVLLYAVPSDLTLATLGGAGTPASLCGMAAALWWCWYQLQRPKLDGARSQPVRVAMFVFAAAGLAAYIAASLRPLPTVEASTSDTGLLRLVAWSGILLLANDGVPDRERLLLLLRRLTTAGCLMAMLGLAQFLTGTSLIGWFSIPGFTSGQTYDNVQDRNGFTRAAATAMHPLEYATVLCMILPIALALALNDTTRSRLARWFPPAIIVVASVLSVSRSTLLGVAAGLLVLAPTWPPAVRRAAGVAALGLALSVYVLIPGLVGTITNLFTGFSDDAGAASRTDSYGLALQFFLRNPVFGRGFATFLPQYRILDNQYLQLLIETGAVGVLAFLAVVVSATRAARSVRRRSPHSLDRELGQALAASMIAGAVLFAFFDAFSFPMAGATLFLFAGLCGAFRRLAREELDPVSTGQRPAEHGD